MKSATTQYPEVEQTNESSVAACGSLVLHSCTTRGKSQLLCKVLRGDRYADKGGLKGTEHTLKNPPRLYARVTCGNAFMNFLLFLAR